MLLCKSPLVLFSPRSRPHSSFLAQSSVGESSPCAGRCFCLTPISQCSLSFYRRRSGFIKTKEQMIALRFLVCIIANRHPALANICSSSSGRCRRGGGFLFAASRLRTAHVPFHSPSSLVHSSSCPASTPAKRSLSGSLSCIRVTVSPTASVV